MRHQLESQSFQEHLPSLWAWYQECSRALPWRQGCPDPYRVWISEVMSQQSTMATVVPYFQKWMQRFSSLEELASADEAEVLQAWAGLGYYSRARNVHRAARKLVQWRSEHRQKWPRDYDSWKALPGVGPYTAAAVSAIAFEAPRLPLDGNVFRVLSRFFAIPNPLNEVKDRKRVEELLSLLAAEVPEGFHGRTAQALMELGALVCRPGAQALCASCPVQESCGAFQQDRVSEWPWPKERKSLQKIQVLALLYGGPHPGSVLLRQISPQATRLAGQWELPLWELDPKQETLLEGVRGVYPVRRRVKHTITHHQYEVFPVEAGDWGRAPLPSDHCFWHPSESFQGTLTTLTRKILLI